MKLVKQLLLIIFSFLLSTSIFAAKTDTTISFNFVNMTSQPSNALLQQSPSFNNFLGPLLPANGGKSAWSPTLPDYLYALGAYYPNQDEYVGCSDDGWHMMIINPEIYKGDTITVIFKNDMNDNLFCTCTGSACDDSSKLIT